MIGAAAAAAILIGLLVAAAVRSPDREASAAASSAAAAQQAGDPMLDARTKGDPNAPIAIFELSDFQCPYCKQFFDSSWAEFQAEYVETGKVRLTFLNLPLIQIHPHAAEAHEVAMCAASQDKFWPLHDRLFETQNDWNRLSDPTGHFLTLAEEVGVDRPSLDACLASDAVLPIVAADVQLAIRNRLNSTPTFIIEGGVLQGAVDMPSWRMILDSIYTAKTGG